MSYSRFSRLTSVQMSRRLAGSSPVVGSSRNRISGRCTSASARSSRRRMPPEYFPTRRSVNSLSFTISSSSCARFIASRLLIRDPSPLEKADLLGIPVVRPQVIETTALGAAYLAGLSSGVYRNLDELSAQWQGERRFHPTLPRERAAELMQRWEHAVAQATL